MSGTTTTGSTTITSTTVTVTSGETYLSATIGAGGELLVRPGGEADGATVGPGGLLLLKSGATVNGVTVSNTTVTSGTDTMVTEGTLDLTPGSIESGAVFSGGVLELASGGSTGMLTGIGSTLTGFDTLVIDKGAQWNLTGTVQSTTAAAPTLSNSGTVTLDGGFIFHNIAGSGTVTIDSSASLEVQKGVAGGETIGFASNGSLILDAPGSFNGTIENFTSLDTLDLTGFKGGTPTFTTDTMGVETLTIPNNNGTSTLTFTLSGVPAGTNFSTMVTKGDTFVTDDAPSPCFCPGTLIRTERGETPVEDLAIGDRVVTHAGVLEPIRWIGRRSYGGRFLAGRRHILPVRIRAGALADNVPQRDLWVSPNHAMYLDGALIPAGLLVNGVSIVQEEAVDTVHYIHIELAEHNVIWAEGAASESFIDDDSRATFHNAHDYAVRYPAAASTPALYCAPRLEDGYALEAVRRRVDERAGLARQAPELGTLRGCLDGMNGDEVRGWAQDLAHPEAPVCLDVLVDGVPVAQTLAGLYREDLQRAGMGSGRHSFAVRLPAPLPDSAVLEVRRSADAARLARITLGPAALAAA